MRVMRVMRVIRVYLVVAEDGGELYERVDGDALDESGPDDPNFLGPQRITLPHLLQFPLVAHSLSGRVRRIWQRGMVMVVVVLIQKRVIGSI